MEIICKVALIRNALICFWENESLKIQDGGSKMAATKIAGS